MIVWMDEESGRISMDSSNDMATVPYHAIQTDGSDLEIAKAQKKLAIKHIARQKILKIIPQWKQDNYLATACIYLLEILRGNKTTEDADVLALESLFLDTTTPIRTASDSMEAEVDVLTTVEDVQNYSTWGNALWP